MLILFEELPGKKIMRGQRQPEDILGGLRWPETALLLSIFLPRPASLAKLINFSWIYFR